MASPGSATRADVLVARRRLGFGAEGRREHFVVVQSDRLAGIETVVVAPLDDDAPMYKDNPLSVRVPAREAGPCGQQFVLAHLVASALLEKFEAAPSGRLSARSMQSVDAVLRTVLDL